MQHQNYSTPYGVNDYRSYELYHYGILGMKWGIRRYQNPDGSLTDTGRRHYGKTERYADAEKKLHNIKEAVTTEVKDIKKKKVNEKLPGIDLKLTDAQKRYVKIGATALGTALAVYGAYKLNKVIKADIDTKNLTLASLAGNNFANKFIDVDARPIHGVGAMANNRYANAIRIGNEARGPLSSRISEKVYSDRGGQFNQLKRVKQLKDLTNGKKTLGDIFSYTNYTKQALDETKWDQQGQEWLARALRDLNNMSGGGVYRFRHS